MLRSPRKNSILAALFLSAIAGQAIASPPSTSFTYQGQAKQAGAPMNGSVPMVFKLWDAPTGGNQIGAALTFNGVGANPPAISVTNGLFTAALDFGADAFADNQARWLEITVNGQTLTSRQAMTPAPFALNTRGLNVDTAGHVGVLTAPIRAALQVVGAAPGFPAFSAGTSDDPGAIYNITGWDLNPCVEARSASTDFPPGFIFHHIDRLTMGLVAQDSPRGIHVTGPTNEPAAGLFVDGSVGIGTTSPSRPLTIQIDDDNADPAQVLIQRASNPNQQLLIGMASNQDGNYASIEAIEQGQDFRPICLNPLLGSVGIGTTHPNVPFQVVSHNDLPNVRFSAGPESVFGSFLSLDATAQPGGQDWWLFSTGGQAGEGQGKFVLKSSTGNFYAMAVTPTGNMGIGTTNPGPFRLAVNGNTANSTGSWSIFSDARLKQNITALTPGALDRLLSLHGAQFEYTPAAIHDRGLAPGRTVGFIAQEVEKVFPEWVSTDADGYRYITERGTTALMVEALRELRAEKDAQISQINAAHEAEIQKLQRDHEAEVTALSARLTRLEAAFSK